MFTSIPRHVSRINMHKILDNLYLLALATYITYLSFEPTLFSITWPPLFENGLRISAFSVVLLKIGYSEKGFGHKWIACVFYFFIFLLSYMSTGYSFLLDIAILMMGAMDVSYKRILKTYFYCSLIVFAVTLVGSLTGSIEDLIYYENGVYKHSFGIGYTTDFAAHFVYLLLVLWVISDRIPPVLLSATMAFLAVFVYSYSGTRCSAIVLLLSAAAVIYVWQMDLLENKNPKFASFSKVLDKIQLLLIPVCAVIMIALSITYSSDSQWMVKINNIISGRLRLANAAIQNYGITWLGTAFDMVGYGGSTISRVGYNFVDSSYCMILIRYGALLLVAVGVFYLWTANRAIRIGNRKILAAMLLIVIHSMIEHHFLELAYNAFVLLPFATISRAPENGQTLLKKERTYYNGLFYTIAIILLFLVGPRILQYGRTLVTFLHLNYPERNIYFIIGAIGIIFVSIILIKTLNCAFVLLCEKRKLNAKMYVALLVCSALMGLTLWTSERLIRRKQELYFESVKRGKSIIEELLDASGSEKPRIYVDDIPEFYIRQGADIDNGIITGNGLAAQKNIVCFANINKEYYRLLDNNFMFGELSDQQGIYTNSSCAADIVRKHGIDMQNFYSAKQKINLQKMAAANDLRIDDDDGILIEGQEKSLEHGPWITVRKGKLKVEFELKLLSTDLDSEAIAKLRLSKDSGGHIIQEKDIFAADFNEEGYCKIVMEQEMENAEGVEFLILANSNTRMKILGITLQKIARK